MRLRTEVDGDRPLNLNGNTAPTATQTLMTMYRRRSPEEEFNPKLVILNALLGRKTLGPNTTMILTCLLTGHQFS